MKTLGYKYHNKVIITHDNGLEESKLNSTVNANSGAHTLTDDKIIKSPFTGIT